MKSTEEKKDTVEKEFIAFPDIAADVINVLLYQGKEVVKAENLLAGPTETIYQGWKKQRSQYEDLCKYELADGRVNIMYLIANQSRTDGKMLLRKAGYTGGVYREQYEKKTQGIREEDEITVCELFDQYVRQGRAEGENRFAKLVKQLIDGGRSEDLRRAVSDQSYREQLYAETGLA